MKKATSVSNVGDYIQVHESQKAELLKRGMIEENGVEENPDAPKPAAEKGNPAIGSTANIVDNTKEKVKK